MWPVWLRPLYSGFSSREGSPKEGFKTTVGPTIDRPVATSYLRTQQWSSILSSKKRFDDFLTFYEKTTRQGSLPVEGTDPLTGSTVQMRIRSIGTFQQLAPEVWRIGLVVDIL